MGLAVLPKSTSRDDAGHIEASIPAWHRPEDAQRVVDVTGGGNSFLGGFVARLASQPEDSLTSAASLHQALQWGAISACECHVLWALVASHRIVLFAS